MIDIKPIGKRDIMVTLDGTTHRAWSMQGAEVWLRDQLVRKHGPRRVGDASNLHRSKR